MFYMKNFISYVPLIAFIAFMSPLHLAASSQSNEDWDPIIRGTKTPTQRSNSTLEDLQRDGVVFQARTPDLNIAKPTMTLASREPASAKGPPAMSIAKSTKAAAKIAVYETQKPRLPASVSDGFEMRVKLGAQVSTFWVIKRGDHHDLLFANNSGSKLSIGLSYENFNYLQSVAHDIPGIKTETTRCPASIVQMQVVEDGKAIRTVESCANTKGAAADRLRNLGGLLSNMIR
jgi:hypothetical protein